MRLILNPLSWPTSSQVLFEGTRAFGVRYAHAGNTRVVRARKEVILSAGAIATPQLLMLSGVGPKEHLEQHQVRLLCGNHYTGSLWRSESISRCCFLYVVPCKIRLQTISEICSRRELMFEHCAPLSPVSQQFLGEDSKALGIVYLVLLPRNKS